MDTGRLKRIAGRALLVSGAVLLALLIGELAARAFLPVSRGIAWHHYDARYGHRHRAGIDRMTTVWGDGARWRVRTNSHGFRGPEWSFAEAEGERRVLVMGDSFTFGHGVSEERAFPAVADRVASERGRGWRIRNLGVSASGPQNALAYLETEGAEIEASCLVYAIYDGNDVMDGALRPVYADRDGRWERVGGSEAPSGWVSSLRTFARTNPAHDLLIERSQLYNVIRRRVLSGARRADGARAPTSPSADAPGGRARLDALFVDHRRTLERMEALARRRFGGFALVLIPTREQAQAEADQDTDGLELARRTHDESLAWARDHGVAVFDVLREMLADPRPASAFYFERDFHFSPTGARFVGARLGRRVERLCQAPAEP